MAIIHTGSTSIDRLLGGGIHTGTVSDIYGQSGAGKSQLCFTLCANYAKHSRQEDRILFIDTVGTFRPERVSEIVGARKNSSVHIKLKLEIIDLEKSLFGASLMQPIQKDRVLFNVTSKGISDE